MMSDETSHTIIKSLAAQIASTVERMEASPD
jgi:hypothetical protein